MNEKSLACSNGLELTSHSLYSFLATGGSHCHDSEHIIQTGNYIHVVIQPHIEIAIVYKV